MMIRKFTQQKLGLLFIIALGFISACKKSSSDQPSVAGTRDQLTKDSIYLYAQQTYYWNVGMPTFAAFNPRQYATNDDLVEAIKKLSSNGGKDKYSFIDDGTVGQELSGNGGDFGFSVIFNTKNDLRIKYVYNNSPASAQGLKRGYQITKINGNTSINNSDAGTNLVVNAIFGSSSTVSLTVLKPDGSSADVVVNKANYAINPILFTNTYTAGTKKVGYIVFNSFTTNTLPGLDAAFAKFASDGITELIVDLRYNGGGSVATSQAFTNLIAPSAQNGKVMNTTFFNQTMQDGKATILQNQKFNAKGNDGVTRLYSYFDFSYLPTQDAGNQEVFAKRGSLEGLTRVYFLVSSGTASASELLINNLKPVLDVKLVGRKTYGKPVGFFAITIDKFDLYIPQFETKNQLNIGGYYDGLAVDKDVFDDVTKEFGDPSEALLSQALNYAATGNFKAISNNNKLSSTSAMSISNVNSQNMKLDHSFKGMVETKKLKLK